MKNCLGLIFLLIVIFSHPLTVSAGAWTHYPGNGFVLTEYLTYSTSETFTNKGDKVLMPNDGKFTKHTIQIYLEQGVTEKLTVVSQMVYDYITYTDIYLNQKRDGFADQQLGLRYRLVKEPIIISFYENIVVPGGYDNNVDLPLGHDQVDLESWLLFAKGFDYKQFTFYTGFDAGYIFSLKEPPDMFEFQLMAGAKGFYNLDFSISANSLYSLGSGKETYVAKNRLAKVNYDLHKLSCFLSYEINPNVLITLSYFNHIKAKNTGAGQGYGSGVMIRW